MTVDDALLSHLTKLTKLELSDGQRKSIQQDLKNILAMVDKLKEVDVEGVAPLRYVSTVENDLRPDEIANELSRAQALANAPATDEERQFFRVPRVIQ